MRNQRTVSVLALVYILGLVAIFTYVPWVADHDDYAGFAWLWFPPHVDNYDFLYTPLYQRIVLEFVAWTVIAAAALVVMDLIRTISWSGLARRISLFHSLHWARVFARMTVPRIGTTAWMVLCLCAGSLFGWGLRDGFHKYERFQLLPGQTNIALDGKTGLSCRIAAPVRLSEGEYETDTSHEPINATLDLDGRPLCSSIDSNRTLASR